MKTSEFAIAHPCRCCLPLTARRLCACLLCFANNHMQFVCPFYFSWSNLALGMLMWFFTGCLGICMCFHRQLTHKSYKTHKWLGKARLPILDCQVSDSMSAHQGLAVQLACVKHHLFLH
jgi:fatty-acid desaturase